jgi:predicted nucleic acid-binding protein
MVLEIGLATGHSPYDCLYAAFAVAMGAEHVVVADGPFHKAMRSNADRGLARLLLPLDEWAGRAEI